MSAIFQQIYVDTGFFPYFLLLNGAIVCFLCKFRFFPFKEKWKQLRETKEWCAPFDHSALNFMGNILFYYTFIYCFSFLHFNTFLSTFYSIRSWCSTYNSVFTLIFTIIVEVLILGWTECHLREQEKMLTHKRMANKVNFFYCKHLQ